VEALKQFLRTKASIAIAIARVSYGNSDLVSVTTYTDRSPGEIETSGFHRMIA